MFVVKCHDSQLRKNSRIRGIDYYGFRPTQNSLIHIQMICATLPAIGSWRPMAHQVTSRASCLPRDHKFFFCRTSPDPLSHHFCLSTSSEQFRIFGLVSYKRYAVQLIDWSALFECGLSVNRISKFASIFW